VAQGGPVTRAQAEQAAALGDRLVALVDDQVELLAQLLVVVLVPVAVACQSASSRLARTRPCASATISPIAWPTRLSVAFMARLLGRVGRDLSKKLACLDIGHMN
jgi:hypothetical protein